MVVTHSSHTAHSTGQRARTIEQSERLWARAEHVIPGGTQTLSKGPDQFVRGVTPIFLQRGRGSRVWDVDGHEYIDYPLALGPILLGHAYPATIAAVTRQLEEGVTFTLMHPLEVQVAELLCECVPCAEMVRFAKNGSDVTAAAVRLARACTGREKIAYCGYHGSQDWYIATTARNRGVPRALGELALPFRYNQLASLERLFAEHPGQIAAVIMEQGTEDPVDTFLHRVRELAHHHGALLIFDEVVTGFRFALGGIQEHYGVVPDLACLGKGMANGMPLAALVGKREVMQELHDVFFSMTYGGEALSLAAAAATLRELREGQVLPHIWRQGTQLRAGLQALISEAGLDRRVELIGHPPRSGLVFRDENGIESPELRGLFLQETVKRGVLFGGPLFISYSHTDADIDRTLEACAEALIIVWRAVESGDVARFLEGAPPQVVFRRVQN